MALYTLGFVERLTPLRSHTDECSWPKATLALAILSSACCRGMWTCPQLPVSVRSRSLLVLGTVSLKQVVTLPQSSCAHRKTKVGVGNGEQVHGVLHVFRTTGIESTIIRKQDGSYGACQSGPWSWPEGIASWTVCGLFCIWCWCLGLSPGRYLSAWMWTSCWTVLEPECSLVSLRLSLGREWMTLCYQGLEPECCDGTNELTWWICWGIQTHSWCSRGRCGRQYWRLSSGPWRWCTGQRSAPGTFLAAGVQRTPCQWFHVPFGSHTGSLAAGHSPGVQWDGSGGFLQFLLNHVASIAKGGLACWWLVADVGPVQSVLLPQQLGDFFVVLIEPVLMFALGGAKGLIGWCIHGVTEWGPAVFHVICDLDVLCTLLHYVGQLSTNWRLLQFRDVKSLWCWLSPGPPLWENSDLHLEDDQLMVGEQSVPHMDLVTQTSCLSLCLTMA